MAIVSTYPVNLSYNYGASVGTINSTFTSSDGIIYNISPILANVEDATFSQSSLNILSNNVLLSNCLSGTPQASYNEYVFNTTISLSLYGSTNYFYVSGSGINTPIIGLTTNNLSATVFTVQFNSDGTISFSTNGKYITLDSTSVLKLSAYNTGAYSTKQSFNYSLNSNNISLFTVSTGNVACINTSLLVNPKKLFTSTFTTFNDVSTQVINVFSLDRYTANFYKSLGQTSNVQYIGTTNTINIANATSDLQHNYLLTAPYTTVDETTNSLGYNITPLKNYYSPSNIQTPTLNVQSRTYNKLYTGLNTESGYDKIYLSYLGDEIKRTFVKDKDTYFHYPDGAPTLALNSSTLAIAGAVPGSSPWRSDRIFFKQADYGKYSPYGDQGQSLTLDGTYFCSWLSASPTGGAPAWMDRYYNPNKVNLNSVLYSPGVAGSSDNNYPDLIWDVPTTQSFTPERLYVYHKIGDNDNLAVVNGLSGSLAHYISTWVNPLYDSVTNTNTGIINNYTTQSVHYLGNTRYPILNTAISFATLTLTDKDFYVPGFTLAFQAYSSDWSNVRGDQIVGNFYNGGIGLFKNNPLLTPFVTIVYNSTIATYNTYLTQINGSSVSTAVTFSGTPYILKGKHTETYFAVDASKTIYEFDQDGVLLNVYTTAQTLNGTLIGAHLVNENDVRKIIIVLQNGANINWYKFLTTGNLDTTSGPLSGAGTGVNSYVIDLSSTVSYYNGLSGFTVDSNNVVYALSGNVLVKDVASQNPSFILSAYNAEYIACDHENNIWLLYGGVSSNNLCKIDPYGRKLWDINLSTLPIAASTQFRTISFTAELDPFSNSLKYYGLILDGINQTVTKVEPLSGLKINLNVASVSSIPCQARGDATGYDYQRKYIYPDANDGSLKVTALVNDVAAPLNNSQVVELYYDGTTLTPGWHHFGITMSPTNILSLYVDGVSAAAIQVGDPSLIYRVFNQRNNPHLMIGTSSFKIEDLATYTQQSANPYAFVGGIADVRFYSKALATADIKAIQRSFNTNSYKDLVWSSPAGSRYYIEQIDRFFLHRMPGAKSQMFNIRIKNSNITNTELRNIIEQNIIASLSKTTPVYTNLNKIIWE